jgi:phosphoribosyl 1,2-cyclic phosphodiesterase
MRCLYPALMHCRCSLYCTMGVMSQMVQRCRISSRIHDYHVPIFKEIPFRVLDMEITAFETSHDVKSVGFSIQYEGETFVVATDMGMITDRAAHYMAQANHLMIECNYDHDMLVKGHYPQMLKDRVMGPKGHLDNAVAAQFVAQHYHAGLQHVFMCHLSKDNNTTELAVGTMRQALEALGLSVGDASNAADQRNRNVQICSLPRYSASDWYVLA